MRLARNYGYIIADNLYHTIRIVRNGANIKVYGDGALVLDVNNGVFPSGQMAIGTFKGTAYFDEVNITETTPPAPTIFRSPATMSFSAVVSGANPPSQTLQISNSGGGTLSWSVSDDQTWLSLSPSSGSSTGETDDVTVSVTIAGLAVGAYTATITISAPGATNTPQATAVTLTITPPAPTISRSPATMSFSAVVSGANPPSQTLQISNSGGGTLSWSVSANQNWLSLFPSSGSSTGETDNVTASVNIAGLAVGTYMATITISAPGATNTPQTTAATLNMQSNQAPTIVPTPLSSQNANQAILIQANVTDDIGIASVQLHYRRGGDTSFTTTAMTVTSGSSYQGSIPANVVNSRGVEYFIMAADAGNLTTRAPVSGSFSILVQVANVTKPSPQPGGSEENAYRLISVPIQANNASATAILEDDLGTYADTRWRLFGLISGRSDKRPYIEVSQTGTFTPGKSLFLIVKESSRTIDSDAGQSIRTDKEFAIPLESGHNFVATPFNFEIPNTKLRLKSGATGSTIALKTYTGVDWVAANKLLPWEGYYIANNSSVPETLFVNPNLSSSEMLSKKDAGGWRLQIRASCHQARDIENFAGVATTSADGWDLIDLAEPPPIGEYVSLYFPHPEWQKPLERYSDDLRSSSNPNQRWRFVVETNITNEMVTLRFGGLQNINGNLEVFLVDEALKYKQNLRENAVYQYQQRSHGRPKEFTLIVSKDEFVSEQTANAPGVPEDFVLEQNFPNPFNLKTAIRFGLPEKSEVTIKIFDLVGHEVATLLDRAEMTAGRHQCLWDGRDAQGRAVVRGVYFCQIAAGDARRTMKLTVMR